MREPLQNALSLLKTLREEEITKGGVRDHAGRRYCSWLKAKKEICSGNGLETQTYTAAYGYLSVSTGDPPTIVGLTAASF